MTSGDWPWHGRTFIAAAGLLAPRALAQPTRVLKFVPEAKFAVLQPA